MTLVVIIAVNSTGSEAIFVVNSELLNRLRLDIVLMWIFMKSETISVLERRREAVRREYKTPRAEKLAFDYTNVVVASGGSGKRHGDNGHQAGCERQPNPGNGKTRGVGNCMSRYGI